MRDYVDTFRPFPTFPDDFSRAERSMIYADSVSLIRNAQCHTLLTGSGHREIEAVDGGGRVVCPACGRPTRVVLIQEFEAFHVCENELCSEFTPKPGIAQRLAAIAMVPITRHGS